MPSLLFEAPNSFNAFVIESALNLSKAKEVSTAVPSVSTETSVGGDAARLDVARDRVVGQREVRGDRRGDRRCTGSPRRSQF